MTKKQGKESLQERLRQLRETYMAELPDKVYQVEQAWAAFASYNPSQAELDQLRQKVHKLTGSSATYGFTNLSRAARRVEACITGLIEQSTPVSGAQRRQVEEALTGLHASLNDEDFQRAAERFSSTIQGPDTGIPGGGLVYVVDDDPDVGGYLAQNLRAYGYQVQEYQSLGDMGRALESERPAVIILDIIFPEGELAGVKAAAELRKGSDNPPAIIFLSSRSDMFTRLEAMRAGAAVFLAKPVDVSSLLSKLSLLTVPMNEQERFRVLVVDDDRTQALYCAAILQKAGMQSEMVTDPMTVMGVLDRFLPDLILLDLYMDNVGGLELASVIRQREDLGDIPIVFLSGETDSEKRFAALSLGADDFLTKPISPVHLVSAVRSRILRTRATQAKIRLLAAQDRLTGLYNRDHFLKQLESALEQAQAGAPPRPLIYLEIDQYRLLTERLGMQGEDRLLLGVAELLRQFVGTGEAVGRMGGSAFALLLRRGEPGEVESRAEQLRRQLEVRLFQVGDQSVSITASLGVALVDNEAHNAEAVFGLAEQACWGAETEGGNRWRLSQRRVAEAGGEEDEGTLPLLRKALDEDGFRLVFQPIVSLHGEQAAYYEVYLRLRDAQGEQWPARRFLPVAERHGLMPRVDRWVLEETLRVAAELQRQEKSARFFVTLSAESAADPELTLWLGRSLKAQGLVPGTLVCQLTAEAAKADPHAAHALMTSLRAQGIGTGLTRFGLGSAPLALLHHVNVEFLKFDGELARQSLNDRNPGSRLRELVTPARAQGKLSIVPFVEDASTLAKLWGCGVDYVQGYFVQEPFARPSYEFSSTII